MKLKNIDEPNGIGFNLFGSGRGITAKQAAEIWCVESVNFAEDVSDATNLFELRAKRINDVWQCENTVGNKIT